MIERSELNYFVDAKSISHHEVSQRPQRINYVPMIPHAVAEPMCGQTSRVGDGRVVGRRFQMLVPVRYMLALGL